jgi:hypothetical protein
VRARVLCCVSARTCCVPQAVAAYRAAVRLMVGSHAPRLAIASELVRVANLPLAREFIAQTASLCSTDPLLWHEAGVVEYKRDRFRAARRLFVRSLTLATRSALLVDDADVREGSCSCASCCSCLSLCRRSRASTGTAQCRAADTETRWRHRTAS